jgi:cellulose biosynthesis protein BcsQ
LHVLPGDLGLSSFEDNLSGMWPRGYDGDEAALRTTTAFHRIVQGCAAEVGAEIAFVDVGPNLGAINRAALLTADHILIPLAADLFSLQGLRNVGPVIRGWRESWQENVLPKVEALDLDAPRGSMEPMGYVVLQHAVRLDRPVKAYDRWLTRIPEEFARAAFARSTRLTRPRPIRTAWRRCATTARSCPSPRMRASRCSTYVPPTVPSARRRGSCRPVARSSTTWPSRCSNGRPSRSPPPTEARP